MRSSWLLLWFISVIALYTSCDSKETSRLYAGIEDQMAKTVLERAVAKAGGMEHWKGLEHISYVKRSILYLDDGTIESDVVQHHNYQLYPDLRGEISWNESGKEMKIVYLQKESFKSQDGQVIKDSESAAQETFMSAYYVLFIPFKLLDPGTQLSYIARDTLESGHVAEVLEARYDSGQNDNHSTDDLWWYYFDAADGTFLASMVYHAPTYAFIENLETTDGLPLVLNTYRKSWRVDSLRNKQYLRGEFFYSEFEME